MDTSGIASALGNGGSWNGHGGYLASIEHQAFASYHKLELTWFKVQDSITLHNAVQAFENPQVCRVLLQIVCTIVFYLKSLWTVISS